MNTAPWLLFIPLMAQAVLMIVDEFYYHHKRGLPLWEIIGHPLDTLTVIAPLFYAYVNDYQEKTAFIYILLALFSCIFVVKDELIHKDICSKGEMLLHGLLFICHPLVFLSIFLFWRNDNIIVVSFVIPFKTIILGQLGFAIVFLIYQISYWGMLHDSSDQQRNLQRTRP